MEKLIVTFELSVPSVLLRTARIIKITEIVGETGRPFWAVTAKRNACAPGEAILFEADNKAASNAVATALRARLGAA